MQAGLTSNAGLSRRRHVPAAAAFSLCALWLLVVQAGCEGPSQPAAESQFAANSTTTLTVNVLRLQLDEQVRQQAIFFGTLRPDRQSRLGFGRGGRVLEVFKRVGETAALGEKLAELEQGDLEFRRNNLQETLETAKRSAQASSQLRLAAAQEQIQQLETQLREVESELAKGMVLAPYPCIVAAVNVSAGSLVSQQMPALEVIEDTKPMVDVSLPRQIADVLLVGERTSLMLGERRLAATVRSKSPLEAPVGSKVVSLQITSEMDRRDWSFGQTVEVRLLRPTGNSGYWIPFSALSRSANGLWSALFVTVPMGGNNNGQSRTVTSTVQRKSLELVQIEDDWALTHGSLVNGEYVIANGSHRIVPGQRVTINDVTSQFEKPGVSGAAE